MSDPSTDSASIASAYPRIDGHGWCDTCEEYADTCDCTKHLVEREDGNGSK